MEEEYRDGKRLCYVHPNELVIGVCALCLHQKLLLLQQNQQQHHHISSLSSSSSNISLHKVFSLLNRLHIVTPRRRKSDDHTAAFISQQDSFISINLEDNSIASSWEKKTIVEKNDSKNMISKKNDNEKGMRSVVEHRKGGSCELRWRKRIGQLFQLVRWKKSSSKGNGCHVGSKVKVRKKKVIKHACIDR